MVQKGGRHGKADGKKVLKPVVHALISTVFLPYISWTGRGCGKEKKISLKNYVAIISLISEVLYLADRKFDESTTLKNLKYNIIKHAPANYGTKENDNLILDTDNIAVNETVSRYI